MKKELWSERVDLFDPNIYIAFAVEIEGKPSGEALVSAVKAAFAANEATMSRIVLDENGTAGYERMETSGCKVEMTKQQDLQELLCQNEKKPFDIERGELVRVFVSESRLFIMAHHLAGDGKSVTYLLEDIMRALAGERLAKKELSLITASSFPRAAKLPVFFKWYADSFNRKWKKNARVFGWEDYRHIHKAYWEKRSSQVVCEKFTAEEVEKLRVCAKEMGVSVNSLLTTAFLAADPNNACIGMAVDARANGNRAISNQATGISVDYIYVPQRTFEENARMVHRKVQKKLSDPKHRYFILQFMPLFCPTLIDSILFHTYDLYENETTRKLAEVMGYKGGKTRELGITNLTRLDIPDTYDRYRIRNVMFIPPVVSYAKHIIGVCTMPDGMWVSYHFMSDVDEEKERAFFARAIKVMRELL